MHREDFEMLNNNIVYFDNGATTFKPKLVVNAINDYYTKYTANAHRGDYKNSLLVNEKYDEARQKVANFINAESSSEIVFTSGATHSLNFVVFNYFKKILKKGDEVLTTLSEHASNLLPWFVLEKEIGIKVKYIELNEDYEVTLENVEKAINNNTRVIALAHITNVIGDIRPIKDICVLAHRRDIKVVVDAAQSIAHTKVDVRDLDVDFLAFSAHKMYGPTGIGVLYGKYSLLEEMELLFYGGGMNAIYSKDGYIELMEIPTRFEAGTQNIEGVIGLSAAIDYINKIGISNISKYEEELRDYLIKKLKELDFIEIYNISDSNINVAFNIKNVFSQDTAIYLDKYNICIRAGNHCSKVLNEVISVNNTCRISLSFYNTKDEIDLLINVLKNSKNLYKEIL